MCHPAKWKSISEGVHVLMEEGLHNFIKTLAGYPASLGRKGVRKGGREEARGGR